MINSLILSLVNPWGSAQCGRMRSFPGKSVPLGCFVPELLAVLFSLQRKMGKSELRMLVEGRQAAEP